MTEKQTCYNCKCWKPNKVKEEYVMWYCDDTCGRDTCDCWDYFDEKTMKYMCEEE